MVCSLISCLTSGVLIYLRIDLSDEYFLAPPKSFNMSFINRKWSHTSKPSHDDSHEEEEEDFQEPEHTSPTPMPPFDPYAHFWLQ